MIWRHVIFVDNVRLILMFSMLNIAWEDKVSSLFFSFLISKGALVVVFQCFLYFQILKIIIPQRSRCWVSRTFSQFLFSFAFQLLIIMSEVCSRDHMCITINRDRRGGSSSELNRILHNPWIGNLFLTILTNL